MGATPPFGRTVRDRRRALDLTQEELARRVGCAPVTLRKIEYGDLRPSRQIAERLAVALAVPLAEREPFVRAARAVAAEAAPESPRLAPAPAEPLTLEALVARGVRGYQLAEPLGAGGFGAVYRAVQPFVERDVAIKIILPQYADHPEFVRRFEAEARLVARLEHPHIVPLYDYWREPGVAFLVMRLLRGGSLHARLAQGALTPAETIRVLEQIGAALAVAHRAGVIHRDLKPANILLDELGNAYLADFGIAKDAALPPAELSFAGAFVGSPAYSSPEQIRAEPVSPQTDIYALGVLLYELLAGERPFAGPTPAAYLQQHLSAGLPPLAARAGLPPAIDHVLQRAAAKIPTARYPAVGVLVAEARAALLGAPAPAPIRLSPPPGAAPTVALDLSAADNPYQGLRPFAEADAAGFFGREALVQQLLTRMGEPGELARFLAVVGPSGSGKSSAVRAGLLPALRAGGLPGSEGWFLVELVPGADPLAELTRALLRVAPAGVEADDLLPLLRADQRGLLRAARRVLPHDDPSELVLVIDQFEELFTLVREEATRAHLLECLVVATLDDRSRVRVVVTLRADFVDRPLQYVDFGELLKQRGELVLPLTPDELEQAIVGPARRAGLTLEEGLVAALIRDTLGQPGALPLLQHTLSELFGRRQGRRLTLAAYRDLGGVSGALAQSADAIYDGLPAEAQRAARQLALRLITPGEGAEDTRRRARRGELAAPGAEAAITAFVAARLLTLDHDPQTREGTVEVAHEALIRSWPRLRAWLDESREALRLQRQLARMAAEWAAAGEEPSYLASGARLEQFAALAAEREPGPGGAGGLAAEGSALAGRIALSPDEQSYLAASLAEAARRREAEAARRWEREAQRLSAEAALAVERGDPVLGALLALHVLRRGYNPQADSALVKALGACLSWRSAPGTNSTNGRAALSPDGRVLAFPEGLGGVWLYAMEDGQILQKLPAGWCFGVAYAPDGTRIAAGADDGLVWVWDAASGAERARLPHPSTVMAVIYTPDGGLLLSGCEDGLIRAWDVAAGAVAHQLAGHTGRVNSLALAPDGRSLISAGQDGMVIVWDLATWAPLRRLSGHAGEVNDARFAPDGWLIVTAGSDRTVRICAADDGRLVRLLTGHTDQVTAAAFSPDGARVVSASLDGTCRLWAVASGHQLRVCHGHMTSDAFFTADGDTIITVDSDLNRIWQPDSGWEPRFLIGHTAGVWDPIFAPDSRRVVTASLDGSARLWDVASGRELRRFQHPDRVTFAAPAPDWSRLLTTGTDGTVLLWDLASGALLREIARAIPLVSAAEAAFSPDGRLAAVKHADGVSIWEAESGRLLQTITWEQEHAHWVQFLPDGAAIATINNNGELKVWDVASGALRYRCGGAGREIIWAQVLPDGARLLVGGTGLRLLDLATGAELRTITPRDKLWRVFICADGRRAITSDDISLSIWDLADGAELRRLTLLNVRSLGASPDGRLAAVTDFSGGVRLYRLDLAEVIALAEGQLQRGFTSAERERFGIDP